jgi:hypothetical protein
MVIGRGGRRKHPNQHFVLVLLLRKKYGEKNTGKKYGEKIEEKVT